MTVFFDAAYALVIFVSAAAAGSIPGVALGFAAPVRDHRLRLPGAVIALVGWVWFGWLGGRYGISRLGLVLFALVGAVGFVRGWAYGLEIGARLRAGVRVRARR